MSGHSPQAQQRSPRADGGLAAAAAAAAAGKKPGGGRKTPTNLQMGTDMLLHNLGNSAEAISNDGPPPELRTPEARGSGIPVPYSSPHSELGQPGEMRTPPMVSPATLFARNCAVARVVPEPVLAKLKSRVAPDGHRFAVELDVAGYGLGDRLGQPLATSLQEPAGPFSQLQDLNLSENRLSDNVLALLINSLVPPHIRILNLSSNNLKRKAVAGLAELLQNPQTALLSLTLNQCQLGDGGTRAVAEALVPRAPRAGENVPEDLLQQGAPAADSAAGAATEATGPATFTPRLTVLSLARNNIGDGGAQALTVCLQQNRTLLDLNLSWNVIRAPAAAKLCTAVAGGSLQGLNLGWNGLGSSMDDNHTLAKALADALAKNKSLVHLDISHNKLTVEDCQLIGQGLQGNHTCSGIHIEGNCGSVDAYGYLVPDCEPWPLECGHVLSRTMLSDVSGRENWNARTNCWICNHFREVKFIWRCALSPPDVHAPHPDTIKPGTRPSSAASRASRTSATGRNGVDDDDDDDRSLFSNDGAADETSNDTKPVGSHLNASVAALNAGVDSPARDEDGDLATPSLPPMQGLTATEIALAQATNGAGHTVTTDQLNGTPSPGVGAGAAQGAANGDTSTPGTNSSARTRGLVRRSSTQIAASSSVATEPACVLLCTSFDHWVPERMERNDNGDFELVRMVPPGTAHYVFIVDGIVAFAADQPGVLSRKTPHHEIISHMNRPGRHGDAVGNGDEPNDDAGSVSNSAAAAAATSTTLNEGSEERKEADAPASSTAGEAEARQKVSTSSAAKFVASVAAASADHASMDTMEGAEGAGEEQAASLWSHQNLVEGYCDVDPLTEAEARAMGDVSCLPRIPQAMALNVLRVAEKSAEEELNDTLNLQPRMHQGLDGLPRHQGPHTLWTLDNSLFLPDFQWDDDAHLRRCWLSDKRKGKGDKIVENALRSKWKQMKRKGMPGVPFSTEQTEVVQQEIAEVQRVLRRHYRLIKDTFVFYSCVYAQEMFFMSALAFSEWLSKASIIDQGTRTMDDCDTPNMATHERRVSASRPTGISPNASPSAGSARGPKGLTSLNLAAAAQLGRRNSRGSLLLGESGERPMSSRSDEGTPRSQIPFQHNKSDEREDEDTAPPTLQPRNGSSSSSSSGGPATDGPPSSSSSSSAATASPAGAPSRRASASPLASSTCDRPEAEMAFISSNLTGQQSAKFNPKRALCRFQFMDVIVTLAVAKYFRAGPCETVAEAVTRLVENHVQPCVPFEGHDLDWFRHSIVYTEEVDVALRGSLDRLRAVYARNSGKDQGPTEENTMSFVEFQALMDQSNLCDDMIVERHVRLAYVRAKMTPVDTFHTDAMFRRMVFLEFVEAVVRLAFTRALRDKTVQQLNEEMARNPTVARSASLKLTDTAVLRNSGLVGTSPGNSPHGQSEAASGNSMVRPPTNAPTCEEVAEQLTKTVLPALVSTMDASAS